MSFSKRSSGDDQETAVKQPDDFPGHARIAAEIAAQPRMITSSQKAPAFGGGSQPGAVKSLLDESSGAGHDGREANHTVKKIDHSACRTHTFGSAYMP